MRLLNRQSGVSTRNKRTRTRVYRAKSKTTVIGQKMAAFKVKLAPLVTPRHARLNIKNRESRELQIETQPVARKRARCKLVNSSKSNTRVCNVYHGFRQITIETSARRDVTHRAYLRHPGGGE